MIRVREAFSEMPSVPRKAATPLAKMIGGVPLGMPLLYSAPTAMSAITARKPSSSMEPNPIRRMSRSLESCLDVVPEDTRLWNPDTAPQATVTNRMGKRLMPLTVNPVYTGRVIATTMPIAAAPIMNSSRKEFR